MKRLFDFTFAFIGLIFLLPFFLLIGLWIKLDSKGKIFYRQERVGRGGKIFRIHKFRTMTSGADKKGALITVGGDARITKAGSFLRKYKLDELAQLIDVFLGDMSLVGPRPEVAEFMNLYDEATRKKILSVRPGITDLASIEMKDENEILSKYPDPRQAYIEEIMPLKAKFYLDYVEKQTLLLDIKIILKTFFYVFLK